MEAKADPNLKNSWATSPGLIALLKRNFTCLRYLIRQKDVDANLLDNQNRNLASQLCMNFGMDVREQLEFLLDNCNIDITTTDEAGWTVLHHLTNNDPGRVAHELVCKENQEKNQTGGGSVSGRIGYTRYQQQQQNMSKYAKRRAARMARYQRSYNYNTGYNNYHFNYDQYLVALDKIEDPEYRKQEEKRIHQFRAKRREVEEDMIMCAEIFMKNGVDPSGEEKCLNTFLSLALQNNAKRVACWLIEKGASLKLPELKQQQTNQFSTGLFVSQPLV